MELNGKVAVVTGGASGIGRGTVLAFARAGADVVLGDVHEERMESDGRPKCPHSAKRAIAVRCDVTSDEDMEALAQAALAEFGHVDVVMNNAGVSLLGPPDHIPIDDWNGCSTSTYSG